MFFHCILPSHPLCRVQGLYSAGVTPPHLFFKKKSAFKPKAYLLLTNKPSFPGLSHALLLHKPVSQLLADPECWLLPSPASFPGPTALKCPCFFSQFAQVLPTLQHKPSDMKTFMTTLRPRCFSLAYFIISDVDLFANTETVKRKSCTRELIWPFNSIWKRNLKGFVQGKK